MFDMDALQGDLSFISERRRMERNGRFKSANWLDSDFSEPVWSCSFDHLKKPLEIDFQVALDDGSLLTDAKNIKLEHSLKAFLCAQSRPGLASSTQANRLSIGIHIVDYLLLNSGRFCLGKHGLRLITKNDMVMFLHCLHGNGSAKNNLYRPDECGAGWVRTVSRKISDEEVARFKQQIPSIAEIECVRRLDVTDEELIRARCYAKIKGLYRSGHDNIDEGGYLWPILLQSVLTEIYETKTIGNLYMVNTALLEELSFHPSGRYMMEFSPASKNTGGEGGINESISASYINAMSKMALLAKEGFQVVAQEALGAFDEPVIRSDLRTRAAGRTATLPTHVVLTSFRKAVEFYLEYADDIIDSYLNLARAAILQKLPLRTVAEASIESFLTPKLRVLGVGCWDLSLLFRHSRGGESVDALSSREDFFRCLRANKGLRELLFVLYGCMWIIVATMTARRSGELSGLEPKRCLIKTGNFFHIRFLLRKRNIGELHEEVVRPIPTIAAKCIKSLKRIHEELERLGVGDVVLPPPLFAPPNTHLVGLNSSLSSPTVAIFICRFADYFELPLNENGERYYFGTHQLRRFFAMTFFWAGGFGGLDTLRWFLGQTDPEHVWNYITEETPGAVLNHVKARYAGEKIKEDDASTKGLAELLKERYGISRFSLMDVDDIADYIEFELAHKSVIIEPIFFDAPDGKQYEILIKVKGQV